MKYTILCFVPAVILLLAGCAVSRQAEVSSPTLELVSMTPLPPVKSIPLLGGVKMNLLLHVRQDGTVEYAKLLETTGDQEWDSLAIQSVRQWRFAPPQREGAPSDVWVRQLVVVQIQKPIMMTIAELEVPTLQEADSVHALLEKGTPPESIFKQPPKTVDITIYPARVRDALKNLRENEFTRPVHVGTAYRIYKRYPRSRQDDPSE
jgi:TonB family protein